MDLRNRAERAAAQHLNGMHAGDRWHAPTDGYLDDWHDNLLEGVEPRVFEQDLRDGSGSELSDLPGRPAKFRAVFSSSALAVNTFAPFREDPARFSIDGLDCFSECRFEYACPNGLLGTNPHFDFFAASRTTALAVESKFLELLQPKHAEFSQQYLLPFEGSDSVSPVAEAPWARVFRALCDDPQTYRHLDAAQLVKHYLGLRHSFPTRQRALVYVYWEPANAGDCLAYGNHRKEVADFAHRVRGCGTKFLALSHADLWREWEQRASWQGAREHVARLRRRYDFAI
jgi:hypothetical protein